MKLESRVPAGPLELSGGEVAYREYVDKFWHWYMTDAEKAWIFSDAKRIKMELRQKSPASVLIDAPSDSKSSGSQNSISREMTEFESRIRARIIQAFHAGEIEINRCPACFNLARTPKAKQCFECGHDWHEADEMSDRLTAPNTAAS